MCRTALDSCKINENENYVYYITEPKNKKQKTHIKIQDSYNLLTDVEKIDKILP